MNLSKVFAAGAFAAAFAFAQEDFPADEQGEEQSVEQSADASETESVEQSEEPAAQDEEPVAQAEKQEQKAADNQMNEPENVQADAGVAAVESEPRRANPLRDNVGFGLHGDFEYGYLIGLAEDWNGGDDTDAPSGIGFDAGLRVRIPMTSFVQFNPEVNIHYISLTQSDDGIRSKFKQADIEIPLALRAVVFDFLYISAGAQFSLNVYSDASVETQDAIDLENKLFVEMDDLLTLDVKNAPFTMSLVFGAGFYIMDRISLDARITFGITDLYAESDEDSISWMVLDGSKLMSFKFGVGFWIM